MEQVERGLLPALTKIASDLAAIGAAAGRSLNDIFRPVAEAAVPALADLRRLREQAGTWPHDDFARREWPHVPLSLARAYADEYLRTGRRP